MTSKTALSLELSGYKTGQFITPHMFSFDERISINRDKVDLAFIQDFLNYFEKVNQEKKLELTFFDFITLAAFKYWEERKVDIAVVETGLGGLKDSTNIIPNPLLSVITGIGMDHLRLLGPTIKDITCKLNFFINIF